MRRVFLLNLPTRAYLELSSPSFVVLFPAAPHCRASSCTRCNAMLVDRITLLPPALERASLLMSNLVALPPCDTWHPAARSPRAVGMGVPIWLFYSMFTSVILAVGVGVVALVVYPMEAAKADAKIATLASLGLGWMYLGAFAMKAGLLAMGVNLGAARTAARIEVPDQQCYKVGAARRLRRASHT